jgi:hypothetical protein
MSVERHRRSVRKIHLNEAKVIDFNEDIAPATEYFYVGNDRTRRVAREFHVTKRDLIRRTEPAQPRDLHWQISALRVVGDCEQGLQARIE